MSDTAEAAEPERDLSVLPVPTVDVAPETGLSLGAVVLVTFQPFEDARASSVELELALTTRRQRIVDVGWRVYTREERWLYEGDLVAARYPDRFWGVGPDTPEAAAEDYDARRLELEPTVLRGLGADVFVGPSWSFAGMYAVEPTAGGQLAAAGVAGARGGVSSGPGLVVLWDRRDRIANPSAGSRYAELTTHGYAPIFGGDFRFSRTTLDLRSYLGLPRQSVLAMQAYGNLHTGEPPFRMLSMLGGDTITRGYWYGRWRDLHLWATQVEARVPVVWRLGVVGFVGVGEVSPSLTEHHVGWLRPSVGGGLRLMLIEEDGLNLRIDYAVGLESTGFYFGFGEAF